MVTRINVVPIVYNAGTGGNFLAYILDSALIGRDFSEPISFTKYGSAHELQRYFIPWVNMVDTAEAHINECLNYSNNLGYLELEEDRLNKSHEWIFLAYHSINSKELMEFAKKGILITYEKDDIDDILTVILGKASIDGHHNPINKERYHISKDDLQSLKLLYNRHYSLLTDYYSSFQPINDLGNKMLNISWKEIMYSDVNELIEKLSKFTGFEINNFNSKVIQEWRRLTLYCIADLEPLKQQILKIKDLPTTQEVKND
jgi:hypothetical protein